MATFLDKDGLEYYHNNVKDLLDDKENKFETLPSDILFPKDVNDSFKIYKVYKDTDIKLLKEMYRLSVVDYETTTIPKKSLLLYCRDEELTTNALGNANSKLSYSIRVISIYGEDKLIKSTNVHNNGSTGVLTIEWSIEDYPSGSGNTVYVTDEEPETANDGDLYIDSDGIDSLESEVVNSLEGDETTKAPSVKAVNDVLNIPAFTETQLLDSEVSTSSNTTVTLKDDITNYDFLIITCRGDWNHCQTQTIPKSKFSSIHGFYCAASSSWCAYGYVQKVSNTQLKLVWENGNGWTDIKLNSVIGIKFK